MNDIREQLAHLVYPGFILQTPAAWLCHLPRYLKAIQRRLEKLRHAPDKDNQVAAEIAPLWHAYLARSEKHLKQGIQDEALQLYRWMLEELRVSLYAQELKTSLPVSVKRLKEQWGKVRA